MRHPPQRGRVTAVWFTSNTRAEICRMGYAGSNASELIIMSRSAPSADRVIVAVGSNLGDSRTILREAIRRLQEYSAAPVLQSSFIETAPVDCPPGSPDFLNAVVELVPLPGETPESLLAKLRALEREFGRQPKKLTNEPRPLDLDLIAFGNQTCATKTLTLPHPRAHL